MKKSSPPPSSARRRRRLDTTARDYTVPDPNEVEQLAHVVWLHEGAPAGSETQYQREVAFQLRFTRHLLLSEIDGPAAGGPTAWTLS